MKLLQVPTVELESRIKQELEANPALEEGAEEEEKDELLDDQESDDDRDEALEEFDFDEYLDDETPDYKTTVRNHGADIEDKDIPIGAGKSFRELLISQFSFQKLDSHSRMLGEHLIGQIDDDGYLRRDLESIVNDLAFTQNVMVERSDLESTLKIIQLLDPPGVGAVSLQQCLIIQLERKLTSTSDESRVVLMGLALKILKNQFIAFTKKHYSQITHKLEIDEEQLKRVLEEITRLNPKPGNSGGESSRTVQHIVADFIMKIREDEVVVSLNQRNAPELRISPAYKEMMDTYSSGAKTSKATKEALSFVKQKVDAAKWFVDAIRQRQLTLIKTINAIVTHQEAYFLSGDETEIKPMILKDIAERIDMDISTVSRVANSKYVQTPYGTFLLKTFFSESLSTDSGEEASSREVKRILQDAISDEDKRKPLTDEKLGTILNDKGYHIARRTVAKYREQLGIPVARLRKEL
jgi:RNA polymerase sigma-54 factor|tara:strand:- start:278 stop:1681 length:1404 start_codon:yes stop_codon:yes gene_type:complete